jgi:hypothetical protein
VLSKLLAETPQVLPIRRGCCRSLGWMGMVTERLQAVTSDLAMPQGCAALRHS